MSVINNVLKDLESRESSFAPLDIPTLDRRVSSGRDLKPLLPIVLVLLLLVAAGWIILQNRS